jgi:hypothetical protein
VLVKKTMARTANCSYAQGAPEVRKEDWEKWGRKRNRFTMRVHIPAEWSFLSRPKAAKREMTTRTTLARKHFCYLALLHWIREKERTMGGEHLKACQRLNGTCTKAIVALFLGFQVVLSE